MHASCWSDPIYWPPRQILSGLPQETNGLIDWLPFEYVCLSHFFLSVQVLWVTNYFVTGLKRNSWQVGALQPSGWWTGSVVTKIGFLYEILGWSRWPHHRALDNFLDRPKKQTGCIQLAALKVERTGTYYEENYNRRTSRNTEVPSSHSGGLSWVTIHYSCIHLCEHDWLCKTLEAWCNVWALEVSPTEFSGVCFPLCVLGIAALRNMFNISFQRKGGGGGE